jgi:oligosaccharide reducing-end xylanase
MDYWRPNPVPNPNGVSDMFINNHVVFFPKNGGKDFTDPSYHLPAFFEYFARYGGPNRDGGQDKLKWWDIAGTSRGYLLPRATGYLGNVNGNVGTALSPGYSTFDGTRTKYDTTNQDQFTSEAYRVASNIAVDYMWWGDSNNPDPEKAKTWNFHKVFGNRLLNFFDIEGKKPSAQRVPGLSGTVGIYSAGYTTEGVAQEPYDSNSLYAMNAVAAQVATDKWGGL